MVSLRSHTFTYIYILHGIQNDMLIAHPLLQRSAYHITRVGPGESSSVWQATQLNGEGKR